MYLSEFAGELLDCVELATIEQLVSKLGQVHEVRFLVDVTRNEDWPVDALVRVGNLNADLHSEDQCVYLIICI